MEIYSTENVFMFEFCSIKKQFTYKVYSIGKENMIKFLQHHNMMNFINEIKCCDNYDSNKANSSNVINEFEFRSNKREYKNKVFKVYTTLEIIEYSIDKIAQLLCDNLVFGSIVLRDDIKFIDMINDCVNNLPHVGILDIFTVNDCSINDDPYEISGLDSIFESMHSNPYSCGKYQSITIEAYAKCFAEMLLDEY